MLRWRRFRLARCALLATRDGLKGARTLCHRLRDPPRNAVTALEEERENVARLEHRTGELRAWIRLPKETRQAECVDDMKQKACRGGWVGAGMAPQGE